MPKLGLGSSLVSTRKTGGGPIPTNGLSLWLKADAGVNRFQFQYKSQIVITGTGNSGFAGTYFATSVPGWDIDQSLPESYTLAGPNGNTITWDNNTGLFTLASDTAQGTFSSSDGETWTANSYVSQFTTSGFTGIYANANGTYTSNDNGETFFKLGFSYQGGVLIDTEFEAGIAYAPTNFSGAWTPDNYQNSITLSNAGTSSVNGVYTRTDDQFNMYPVTYGASGGRTITFNDDYGYWYTDNNYYENTNDLTGSWDVGSGDEPAPTASYGFAARNIGNVTSTSVLVPAGSVSGSTINSTATSDIVLNWNDQSGNSNNAGVLYSSQSPTFVSSFLNNKPAIQFDGASNVMQIPNSSTLQFLNTSIFIVLKRLGGGILNEATFMKNGSDPTEAGSYWQIAAKDGLLSQFAVNTESGSPDQSTQTNLTNSVPRVMDFTYDGSIFSINVDGVNVGSYEDINGNIVTTSGTLQIGGYNQSFDNPGGEYFNGQIAEIIMYNRAVTNPERQKIQTYLLGKYSIQPIPYKVAVFGAGTYGRDSEYIWDEGDGRFVGSIFGPDDFHNYIEFSEGAWYVVFDGELYYQTTDFQNWTNINGVSPSPLSVISYDENSYINNIYFGYNAIDDFYDNSVSRTGGGLTSFTGGAGISVQFNYENSGAYWSAVNGVGDVVYKSLNLFVWTDPNDNPVTAIVASMGYSS